MALGAPAVFGDRLEIDPRFAGKVPAVFGELLIGEQPGLDPLGQLNLLPGVEQGHLADLLEVVLNRVGSRVSGCRPGGGKVLVVIAGNQRLVLALPARLRRAADRRRDVALAGAWLLLTGRLLPSDLGGGAVPVGICLVIQAHGSADTTTGGSEPWLTGQSRSNCTCHREHPPDRRSAARRAGLDA